MSARLEFIEYVRELLAPVGDLEEGTFFGGFAFKRNSKQFAMIMGNTLYFCVNDQTRPKYQLMGMESFSYKTKRGRIEVKKYFSIPEEFFENQDKLIEWADEAIESARSY